MKQFAVVYVAIPTAYNSRQRAIVEAEDAETALALVKDALGEGNGVHNYQVPAYGTAVTEYTPVTGGRVVSLNG